jgi:hypothetical protein
MTTPDIASPAVPGPAEPAISRWEDIFLSLSPNQQRDLLALAGCQGLLYAHQLPNERNGRAGGAGCNRQVLVQLLDGKLQELEPVRTGSVEVRDAELDAAQRNAVAKALATPDLCLVQGLPGTGKSRVVAELVTQAAARGERVLLSAHSPAAIDRILELVGGREELYALRLQGPEERPETLPPLSRPLTLPERLRDLSSAAVRNARQALAARTQRSRRLRQDAPAWNLLQELADRLEVLRDLEEMLCRQHSQMPAEIECEALAAQSGSAASAMNRFRAGLAAFERRSQEVQTRVEKTLAERQAQLDDRKREGAAVQTQLEAIRPLAEARRQKRWWTRAWWQARARQDPSAEQAALEERLHQLETVISSGEKDLQQVEEERAEAARQLQAERSRLLDAETLRRQADVDHQLAAVRQERHLLLGKWQAACSTLDAEGPHPTERAREAVQRGRALWQQQLQAEEQQAGWIREWISCLEEPGPWPARLRGYANLVAATPAAFFGDPHFPDSSASGPAFDLLVVQEADHITESEFVQLSRHARRWVLVGERGLNNGEALAPGPASGLRKSTAQILPPGLFDRLWTLLHWEPRHLPYAWIQENDRLCCRLRPVPPGQRQWLESEWVADFPDVELRILSLPRTRPQLVEVVFPSSFSIGEAKAYIFKELEELAVQAAGNGLGWVEEPSRLVLRLADDPVPAKISVELEAGVHELVASVEPERNGDAHALGWQTCCLEFDRAVGWDRPRAEEWVQRHLGRRDLSRTARLSVPHRMHPKLAAFLSHVLFGGAYGRLDADSAGSSAQVEFVPVPPLRDAPSQGGALLLPRKGGAGLEVDLADPRNRNRLPSELGADLPNLGFVNYSEAQAVVRLLETLALNPSASADLKQGDVSRPTVAVIALYPAQVELIRRLVRQSPRLASARLAVEIGGPEAFRERECAIVLVSLTRSHSHRAIAFGEGPEMLALALTRARSKLVLFGDPGALARRSQWEGPLDHLDEATAAREREVVTRLVHYLQGQGACPTAFRLRAGAGP